jgi:hypothetical protein
MMKKTSLIFAAALSFASVLAQAQTAAPAAAPAADAPAPAADHAARRDARIEEHIKRLHDQLKITAAEEPQWQTVADVMRSNGETLGDLYRQRAENKNLSATDDLKQYVEITQANADGAKKLADAFQPLYDSFPADQKALADTTFRKGFAHEHAMEHRKAMKKHEHAKAAEAASAAAPVAASQ